MFLAGRQWSPFGPVSRCSSSSVFLAVCEGLRGLHGCCISPSPHPSTLDFSCSLLPPTLSLGPLFHHGIAILSHSSHCSPSFALSFATIHTLAVLAPLSSASWSRSPSLCTIAPLPDQELRVSCTRRHTHYGGSASRTHPRDEPESWPGPVRVWTTLTRSQTAVRGHDDLRYRRRG